MPQIISVTVDKQVDIPLEHYRECFSRVFNMIKKSSFNAVHVPILRRLNKLNLFTVMLYVALFIAQSNAALLSVVCCSIVYTIPYSTLLYPSLNLTHIIHIVRCSIHHCILYLALSIAQSNPHNSQLFAALYTIPSLPCSIHCSI